jgi:hypothetical protein
MKKEEKEDARGGPGEERRAGRVVVVVSLVPVVPGHRPRVVCFLLDEQGYFNATMWPVVVFLSGAPVEIITQMLIYSF